MIRGYPSKLQILSSSRIPQRHFLTRQRTCGVELKSMRSWHKEWYHRFMLIKAILVLIIVSFCSQSKSMWISSFKDILVILLPYFHIRYQFLKTLYLFFGKKISIIGCTSLEEFTVSSDLIENLDLSSTWIQTLDLSIGLLRNLKWLNLEGSRLEYLPKELPSLTSIKELRISGSGLKVKKQQLHVLFDGLRSLQILHLKDCNNLFELPDDISVLSKLQELILNGSNVKRLPESIRNLQGLEILSLEECREIRYLPELPSLIKLLNASKCTSLVSVSDLKKNYCIKDDGKCQIIFHSGTA
ncbi:unnamed protein product [Vicia faba]|uniref:Leucine-rich repeat domain, L domain-containing protein n=1 Tax=Vicia faba TaxID=3906 RepID=A0AAV1APG4_VICFA|nr:unnamed protein product [Vicia faba]